MPSASEQIAAALRHTPLHPLKSMQHRAKRPCRVSDVCRGPVVRAARNHFSKCTQFILLVHDLAVFSVGMTLAALHLRRARQQIDLVLEKRMHSVICIKQGPAPAKIRARFLSNTIVQRGVPTNGREAVAAETPPSSVTSRPARSACTLWDRIHLSPDCGRCAPWMAKLRCCLPNAPLSMTRRYPRRTHARPQSRRSGRYLVGPLSSSLPSRPSMATWARSAPRSQHSPVWRSSTRSPRSLASISPPVASRAERQGSRPPRKRPWV